jgi:hypothetical protein
MCSKLPDPFPRVERVSFPDFIIPSSGVLEKKWMASEDKIIQGVQRAVVA